MDSDLYLIKLVQSRPILWDKKVFLNNLNNGVREATWKDVSDKFGARIDWVKRRWHTLQQRFFTVWNSTETDPPQFKYCGDMLFLLPGVGPNDPIMIPAPQIPLEFDITEKQLEASDEADENVFVEVIHEVDVERERESSSAESNVQPQPEAIAQGQNVDERTSSVITEIFGDACDSTRPDDMEGSTSKAAAAAAKRQSPFRAKTEPVEDIVVKRVKSEAQPVAGRSTDGNADGNTITTSGKGKGRGRKETKSTEEAVAEKNDRCEDTIFGELVAAMLKRMTETKKKQAKKEIMNLLLS